MSTGSSVTQYNLISRINHWLSALLIIFLFALGTWMLTLDYYSSWYTTAPYWHKSLGLLLAGLTVLRLIWRWITSTPTIEGSSFEKIAAHVVHILLYGLLFVIFLSGYLISTSDGSGIDIFTWYTVPSLGELFDDQSDIAGLIHFYCAWILIILALLHVLAALKHHFVNKDNTLNKMLGVTKNDD